MSTISSVSPAPVLKPIEASEPKGPDVKIDRDADDARAAPPPPPAPLPPGQGSRVNIFA
jgi:hypothetical protein